MKAERLPCRLLRQRTLNLQFSSLGSVSRENNKSDQTSHQRVTASSQRQPRGNGAPAHGAALLSTLLAQVGAIHRRSHMCHDPLHKNSPWPEPQGSRHTLPSEGLGSQNAAHPEQAQGMLPRLTQFTDRETEAQRGEALAQNPNRVRAGLASHVPLQPAVLASASCPPC